MYTLGKKSLEELRGVHPDLIAVVRAAIELTTQDFTVYDGARTVEEQHEYVRRGVSKTMKSRHLVQADGMGHAVDLVPWINGMARWEWRVIYPIAVAMAAASKTCDTRLIWGGVWDKRMDQYNCRTALEAKIAVDAYKLRHKGSDFIDGPHFELA